MLVIELEVMLYPNSKQVTIADEKLPLSMLVKFKNGSIAFVAKVILFLIYAVSSMIKNKLFKQSEADEKEASRSRPNNKD